MNGLGHAAWDYAEGNRRAVEWGRRQVRAHSQDVLRIDYTASTDKSLKVLAGAAGTGRIVAA